MRLMELKGQPRVIVVYGGGFQPFHIGHMSSYMEAKSAFPDADFYVAASNDTKTRPIPFDAKKFLAQQAGVVDDFVQVRQPINPQEIMQKYDAARDILVLVRSERDPMSYTKKDGSPGYYQPFVSVEDCEPFEQHGYIFVTKKHTFKVNGQEIYSGSQVREMYANADEAGREAIIAQLYPDSNQLPKIKQIFDQYLSQQGVAEGSLKEFAPDDGGGDEEDMLLKFARMWYNGDLPTQQQIEKILARSGWEIGELESEEGGAFVVQSGDENGNSYIGFSVADLTEGLAEGYGRYYCSTDKRWKERKGPKQTRTTEGAHSAAQQAAIAIHKKEMDEAEGDPKGVPHVTRELLKHIIDQVGTEGAHAIVKSLEWGDGASKELLQIIKKDLEHNLGEELDEASLSQMRDFFAGQLYKSTLDKEKEAKAGKIADMRAYFANQDAKNNSIPANAKKKSFRSVGEYEAWLRKQHLQDLSR